MKLFSTVFLAMIADNSASASASLAGAGRVSGRSRRIDCGTAWLISVSTDGTPITASMALTSLTPGPIWRAEKGVSAAVIFYVLVSADMGFVGGLIHEACELAFVGKLHLPQPAVAGRRRIDQRRVGRQRGIGFGDLAVDGGIHIRRGLDGFDDDGGVALGQLLAGFR